ncbi:DUF362 domain-containing protein [Candidatus Microgenomates bacterium]|nr:DUF362 domain-containing protein [Candidatus Microgenomates bacterium]
MKKTKVALAIGKSRRENILSTLRLLEEDIKRKTAGKKRIVVKPNFVTVYNQLAATHVETIRAILDFLKPIYKGKIIIAEKAAVGTTKEGFKNYHYYDLKKDYDIDLVDLAEEQFLTEEIYDASFKKIKIGIARTVLESDFLISATPAKTHDVGIVTLSLKNVVVGSLNYAPLIHQGLKAFNQNLTYLARKVHPNLSIIDGFEGMGGNGPVGGVAVKSKFAIASLDFLAADFTAARVMGFDPQKIGYLSLCQKENLGEGDLDRIEIIGDKLVNIKISYSKPSTYEKQLRWEALPSFPEKLKAKVITVAYPPVKRSKISQIRGFETIKSLIKRAFGFS